MKRRETVFLIAGLPVAALLSLKLLVAVSFIVIDATEGSMERVPAGIIRVFGGHKDAERMIRSVRDYRDAQYDLTGNLLRMGERFPLSDEPRLRGHSVGGNRRNEPDASRERPFRRCRDEV
jgi:hypothetical protein